MYLLFFSDSQSVIHLAMNQNTYYKITKHIEVKFHYIGDIITNGQVILRKIHSNDNTMIC